MDSITVNTVLLCELTATLNVVACNMTNMQWKTVQDDTKFNGQGKANKFIWCTSEMWLSIVIISWNAWKFPKKVYFPILLYREHFLKMINFWKISWNQEISWKVTSLVHVETMTKLLICAGEYSDEELNILSDLTILHFNIYFYIL